MKTILAITFVFGLLFSFNANAIHECGGMIIPPGDQCIEHKVVPKYQLPVEHIETNLEWCQKYFNDHYPRTRAADQFCYGVFRMERDRQSKIPQ